MPTQVSAAPAPSTELAAQIELARQAAVEVFGNCQSVEFIENPECDGEAWHLFTVSDTIENQDYRGSVLRELRWHDRVQELVRSIATNLTPDFRLSIVVEP